MYRFTAALLLTLLCASTAQASSCGPAQEQHLLAATIYREAIMSRRAHAAVTASILNRLKSGRHGSTICAVITERPQQYEYRLPKRPHSAKWRLAQESARIFLNEYHGQGYVSTEGQVFKMLRNRTSFRAAYARSPRKGEIVIGDNVFLKPGH